MNTNSELMDRSHYNELERDFKSTQTEASQFATRTEDSLFSLLFSNNSNEKYSIYTDYKVVNESANKSIESLSSIEARLFDEYHSLKQQLKELAERFRKAINITHSVPKLPRNEEYKIDSLESEIKTMEILLNDPILDELENQNKVELQSIMELEKKNQEKKQKNATQNMKSPGKQSGSSEPFSESKMHIDLFNNYLKPNSKPVKNVDPKEVKNKINDLIKVINERYKKYKDEMKDIKKAESDFKKQQFEGDQELEDKQKVVNQLNEKNSEIAQLTDQINQITEEIIRLQALLNQTIWEREQIERRNYTIARDKFANSEMMKRLLMIKKRVKAKQMNIDEKAEELEKRRKLLESESEIVDEMQKKVDEKEKEVNGLMELLSSYGIDFKAKLRESQQELEALDLAASLRQKNIKKDSLEQQILDLLNEEKKNSGNKDETEEVNKQIEQLKEMVKAD